nr:NAD(P)-binding domain-containing protein [Tatlockia sp.]
MKKPTIAILGAGSWGTAVAIHLAKCGNRVLLWGHNPKHVQDMAKQSYNQRYLPEIQFPDLLIPTQELQTCLEEADEVIVAVPSHAFAELLTKLTKPKHGLAWLTKGVDPLSHTLLSEIVAKHWGENYPIAII